MCLSPLRGLGNFISDRFLGLTPQAMNLSPLRGLRSFFLSKSWDSRSRQCVYRRFAACGHFRNLNPRAHVPGNVCTAALRLNHRCRRRVRAPTCHAVARSAKPEGATHNWLGTDVPGYVYIAASRLENRGRCASERRRRDRLIAWGVSPRKADIPINPALKARQINSLGREPADGSAVSSGLIRRRRP